ncbi:MAG: metallophosphoesterase, partial [Anaerolineales bacterium]|nr:metallophosphoesterase [Anaerolineales bacterium]
AYYNTEKDRFPNLNAAIDAWFDQMQPIASGVPMMPTYGNHEVLLEENVDDWLARFPTPTGYDDRHYYSFDIANAHFISIYAPQAINDPNALAWLEQDIIAAQAAGQKWIIPYFHVAPFADGTNHSSSQSLRNTLGPIFEQYNVPLVIASHDQAYERTWPLTDAANTAVPTTTAHRACVPETEGVTWVKVSPSGKLSNISWGFSPFGTTPAPAWTSVRHNALHHFLRLRFASDETLQVELWGVVGDGSAPTLVDTFLLADSCEDELLVNEPVQSLKLFADETASLAVDVTHSASTAVSFAVASSQPWLQPSTLLGTTGTPVSLDVDPSALAPGTYTAVVTFTPTSGTALAGRLVTTLVVRG